MTDLLPFYGKSFFPRTWVGSLSVLGMFSNLSVDIGYVGRRRHQAKTKEIGFPTKNTTVLRFKYFNRYYLFALQLGLKWEKMCKEIFTNLHFQTTLNCFLTTQVTELTQNMSYFDFCCLLLVLVNPPTTLTT